MKFHLSRKQTRAKSMLLLVLLGLSSVFVIVEIPGVRAASQYTVLQTFLTGAGPYGVAVDASHGYIFVVDSADDRLLTISDQTNAVISQLSLSPGTGAKAVAVNPTSGMVYVANSVSDTLSVISESADAIVATLNVGAFPDAVAVDPITGNVYVANGGDNTVTVIDGGNNVVVTTINVGTRPDAIAVDVSLGNVWVANGGSGTVMVIPEITDSVTQADVLGVGLDPDAIAVDPQTNVIYVANEGSNFISDIIGATKTISTTFLGVDAPNAIAFDPTTQNLLVTIAGQNLLTVISTFSGTTIGGTSFGGGSSLAIGFDPNNNAAYVGTNLDAGLGQVYAISLASFSSSLLAGPAGTPVALSGSGFLANNVYQVCLDTPDTSIPSPFATFACTSPSSFTTTSAGAVANGATFTVPIASAGGPGYIVVEDNANDGDTVMDYTAFTVTPASLTLTPFFGPVGTSVALSGSGYIPSTTYDYCYDSGASSAPATYSCSTPSTFTSGENGAIPAGTYWNIATGSTDGWFVVLSQGSTVPSASALFNVTTSSTVTVTTTATTTVTEPPTTTTSTVTSVSTATSTTTVTLPPVTSTSTATTTQTETQTSTATVTTPTTITSTTTSISPTTTTLTTTATTTQTSTVTSPTTTTVTSTSPPTTVTSTITQTSTQGVGVPTSDYLVCDQTFLNSNQNMNCHATISPADQGALQGGTDGWHATGGTLSKMQCNNPNGQGQIQCQAQFTPTSAGVAGITNTYSGDSYHAGSSASFLVFVASQAPPGPPGQAGVGVAGSSVTSAQVWCDQTYLNLNSPPGQGQNTNCHATISNADGSDATGTVAWSVTAGGTLASGPPGPAAQCNKPNGQGQIQCQVQLTASATGPVTVTAAYSGTAGHGSSSASFAVFVQPNNNPVAAISDAVLGALKALSAAAGSFGMPLALLAGTTMAAVSVGRRRQSLTWSPSLQLDADANFRVAGINANR